MSKLIQGNRVKFEISQQKIFIESAKDALKVRNWELAYMLGVSKRTLSDWKRERFTITLSAAQYLSDKSRIEIPSIVENLDRYWYTSWGGKDHSKGGRAVIEKYGRVGAISVEEWRHKWTKWWNEEGQFRNHAFLTPKPFKKARESKELAEFVGITLGDGSISKKQITIVLHSVDDQEYGEWVGRKIKKLFDIQPRVSIRKDAKAMVICISRSALVSWFTSKNGFQIGDKQRQQIDVPAWIKSKENYSQACLRGLIDTDGCLFTHRYKAKRKEYSYKKLSFSNSSFPLVKFVFREFCDLGLKPRIAKDEKEVRLDRISDVKMYLDKVGTNNPKILKTWEN